jgi:hypothetical protein
MNGKQPSKLTLGYKLYEWMIMPFFLSNAPGTFIRFMYQILRSLMVRFVMVYFDDFLIYSPSLKSHLEHLRAIFNTLWREQLYVNKKKCKFLTNIVAFVFGFIVSVYGVQADRSK